MYLLLNTQKIYYVHNIYEYENVLNFNIIIYNTRVKL